MHASTLGKPENSNMGQAAPENHRDLRLNLDAFFTLAIFEGS